MAIPDNLALFFLSLLLLRCDDEEDDTGQHWYLRSLPGWRVSSRPTVWQRFPDPLIRFSRPVYTHTYTHTARGGEGSNNQCTNAPVQFNCFLSILDNFQNFFSNFFSSNSWKCKFPAAVWKQQQRTMENIDNLSSSLAHDLDRLVAIKMRLTSFASHKQSGHQQV